jgi:hypothetical protein
VRRAFATLWVGVGCASWAGRADAGARPFAYTQGTESLPESSVELENWFGAEKPRDSGGPSVEWWFGPVIGLTDQLETALHAILVQDPEGTRAGRTLGLGALQLQVSWLLAPLGEWPIDVKLRADYEQPIQSYDDRVRPSVWLRLIASRDLGPLDLTLNLGGGLELDPARPRTWLEWGLGASLAVAGGLRAGAELFGGQRLGAESVESWVGPCLAYGRGRFWAATTLGFGVGSSPELAGRIVIGIAI